MAGLSFQHRGSQGTCARSECATPSPLCSCHRGLWLLPALLAPLQPWIHAGPASASSSPGRGLREELKGRTDRATAVGCQIQPWPFCPVTSILASFLHLRGVNCCRNPAQSPDGVMMSRAGWACGEEPRARGQLSLQLGFGECQRNCSRSVWKLPGGDHPRLAVPHEMGHGKGAQSAPSNHWGHIHTGKGRLGVPGNPSAVPTAEVSHK